MCYRMAGALFDCSEVVVVAKNSEKKKGKKKNRKGGNINEEDGRIPLYGIYAAVGMIIRIVCLGIQCG